MRKHEIRKIKIKCGNNSFCSREQHKINTTTQCMLFSSSPFLCVRHRFYFHSPVKYDIHTTYRTWHLISTFSRYSAQTSKKFKKKHNNNKKKLTNTGGKGAANKRTLPKKVRIN